MFILDEAFKELVRRVLHPSFGDSTNSYLKEVRSVLSRGVNTTNILHDCLDNKNAVLLKYLLENGISNANEKSFSISLIEKALQLKMEFKFIQILVENGANIEDALCDAVRYSNYNTVKYLIENGANLESMNNKIHSTALFYAVFQRKREIVNLLLEYGAQVDPTDKKYQFKSPLHIAVMQGFVNSFFFYF